MIKICIYCEAQGKGMGKGRQGYVTVGHCNSRLNIGQFGLTPGHSIVNLKITLWSMLVSKGNLILNLCFSFLSVNLNLREIIVRTTFDVFKVHFKLQAILNHLRPCF